MVGNSRPPPSRRRDKAQLSCDFCRKRKLRCDRKQPCGTCSARGLPCPGNCPADASTGSQQQPTIASTTIQSRLNQLESLVVSLVHALSGEGGETASISSLLHTTPELHSQALKTSSSDGSDAPKMPTTPGSSEPGVIRVGSTGTVYVSSCHWSAILDSIADLKQLLPEQEENQLQPSPDQLSRHTTPEQIESRPGLGLGLDFPDLLCACHRSRSRDDLLQAMPDRRVVDRLVFVYFNELTLPVVAIVHPPSFLQQYHDFWADPTQVSLAWIGLLYSIMCLATQFREAAEAHSGRDSNQSKASSQSPPVRPRFLEEVTQCLVLCNYSCGGPHAIEALLHYFVIEHTRWPDSKVRNWLLFGLILRLAVRMGYHRDSSHFPAISPFQGEIRRRIWATLYSLDIILSLQMGLPRITKDGQWDAKPPRNLLDTDFYEDSTSLPPSRPENEITPVLPLLCKYKILLVLGQIADWTMTADVVQGSGSGKDEMVLEERLRTAYDSLPGHVKFTALTECLAQKPQDIVSRISTTALLLKGLIVLYRRLTMLDSAPLYTRRPSGHRDSEGDEHNNDAGLRKCIEAALQLLEYQQILDTEQQPGGTLHSIRWSATSTMSHEFLMATVVLSSYMVRVTTLHSDSLYANSHDGGQGDGLDLIESVLNRSYDIWLRESTQSTEARRVSGLLALLFRKLDMMRNGQRDDGEERGNLSTMMYEYQDIGMGSDWASLEGLVEWGRLDC